MKQVTMESVKERIARIENGVSATKITGIGLSLQHEFELACLRELVAVTEQVRLLTEQRDAVVVENAQLKSNLMYWDAEDPEQPIESPLDIAHGAGLAVGEEFEVQVAARMPNLTYRVVLSSQYKTEIELVSGNLPETPATSSGIAALRAEGINYAASRLAAAYNHGFVDKPLAEVGDVVHMILTAKEDMANDPALPADGLSGEYAEKALEDWSRQLRESKGANHE